MAAYRSFLETDRILAPGQCHAYIQVEVTFFLWLFLNQCHAMITTA